MFLTFLVPNHKAVNLVASGKKTNNKKNLAINILSWAQVEKAYSKDCAEVRRKVYRDFTDIQEGKGFERLPRLKMC